jgi:RNA methyltransferase, TrmH family
MTINFCNKSTKIKNILILRKQSKSIDQQLILIEGIREIKMALIGKYKLEKLLICKDIVKENVILNTNYNYIISLISNKYYNKIAYRKNNGGLIAIFKNKKKSMNSITLKHTPPVLLIIDKIEKPGNIGAIFRSADAASVDGIILCNQQTNIFNPNTIRASLGTVFTQEIILEKIENIIYWIRTNKISIITTCLRKESTNLYKINLKKGIAIVIGSESTGVSNLWIKEADYILKIPMYGNIDSLNVSNSVSIILFEVLRQRYFI